MDKRIGFIGVGNMGSAILKGVVKSVSPALVYIADADSEKVQSLSKSLNTNVSSNIEIAKTCDCIFLGVKPQMMANLLEEITPILNDRKGSYTIVSMAAGIKTSFYEEYISKDAHVIRIMPNLPVGVGEGTTLISGGKNATEEDISHLERIMSKTGILLKMSESLIDAGCSVSGCGPAFVCLFIESLAEGGVKCGLDKDTATTLAIQTLLGTAKTLKETNTPPEDLRRAVCSPAGSTIKGVEALEEKGLRSTVTNAVEASFKRNIELGNQ